MRASTNMGGFSPRHLWMDATYFHYKARGTTAPDECHPPSLSGTEIKKAACEEQSAYDAKTIK